MDRAIPEINRLTAKREHRRDQRLHRVNVRSVSKTIQNERPTSLHHPLNKKNKEQMVEGKS